jgi:hypothetical protein
MRIVTVASLGGLALVAGAGAGREAEAAAFIDVAPYSAVVFGDMKSSGSGDADRGLAVGGHAFHSASFTGDLALTPVPAALPLLASALGVFGYASRRREAVRPVFLQAAAVP